METGKKSSIADDHNTNQNEATSTGQIPRLADQFVSPVSDKTLSLDINLLSEVKAEPPAAGLYGNIPSIVITPASPGSYINEPGKDGSTDTSEIFSDTNPKAQPDMDMVSAPCINLNDISLRIPKDSDDKSLLGTPYCDKTLNISRPLEAECAPSKYCIDTSNDEDLEVICRCSSTPIKDTERNRRNESEETNCSISSIETTSPIIVRPNVVGPTHDDSTGQPLVSAVRSVRNSSKDITVTSSSDPSIMSPDLVYHNSHCQVNQENQTSQPLSQISVAPSNPMAYDMSRGVNPSQLPPTPHTTSLQENDAILGVPGGAHMFPGHHHSQGYGHASHGSYSEYYPSSNSSWTDMSYRTDMSPIPPMAGNVSSDTCGYPGHTAGPLSGSSDSEYFVYPSIYVSSAGLISVLLRNDMSVEMTVDRTIRVVSHNHMMAVATDSRGTAACLYHPALKVFQIGTTTDIATDNFRARMGSGDSIVFSNGSHFFKLEDSELQPTAAIKFSDILRDQSVNLLFSSEGYGESLVASCMQVAAQAEYANLPKGGVIVRINGVKVTQTGNGDVTVVTGAKFIRLSPHFGTTRLSNRFVDIEVEKDWTVKLTRGSHSFISSRKRSMVCNGKMEAGFDENNGLKVANLVPRHPLLTDPGLIRRQMRKPARFLGPSSATAKRKTDHWGMGRGGGAY
ncbi:uncharacterized protein LOC106013019 [Aplysia californica]|uniref:Uncharacterized protein LOC106013019 n=1 Tax=Aplysia californica TaxID=6500 RepID=A0ABM1A8X9_APLCA|nr:uncharacterized protein LOC106013019 [Aplysia californica]